MEPKKFNQHVREIISTWRETKKRFKEGGFTNKVNDEFMETKMIKAPFDVETAKKIAKGKIPGRIVTRDGRNVRIICWDAKSDRSIIALIDYKEHENLGFYTPDGHIFSYGEGTADLFMEIPDQTGKKEFRPFDKVLVRQSSDGVWDAMLFCNYSGQIHKYRCLGMNYMYCIPYEGNEHLLGTTINPEEHE